MHILIDQDGTLADWGAAWDKVLDTQYPHQTRIPRTVDQRSFNLKLNLTEEEKEIVDLIFDLPGFYANLDPIEGAIEAYHEMVAEGHFVQIATSPWWSNPSCLQDKSDWVAKHLGEEARSKIVFTSDKTGLLGDFLIDDKPGISGRYGGFPAWEQIYFDQPYNREEEGLRITHWSKWREVLEEATAPIQPAFAKV